MNKATISMFCPKKFFVAQPDNPFPHIFYGGGDVAVRCVGYVMGGVEYSEPPQEMIERVRQAFQAEYDSQHSQLEMSEEDEQRNVG